MKKNLSWLHYIEAEKAQEDEINEQLLSASRVFDVSIITKTFFGGIPIPTRIVFAENRYYHNKKEYILEKTKPESLKSDAKLHHPLSRVPKYS